MNVRHATSLISMGAGFIGGFICASAGQPVKWAGYSVTAIGAMGVVAVINQFCSQAEEDRRLSSRTVLQLVGSASLIIAGLSMASLDKFDCAYSYSSSIYQDTGSFWGSFEYKKVNFKWCK